MCLIISVRRTRALGTEEKHDMWDSKSGSNRCFGHSRSCPTLKAALEIPQTGRVSHTRFLRDERVGLCVWNHAATCSQQTRLGLNAIGERRQIVVTDEPSSAWGGEGGINYRQTIFVYRWCGDGVEIVECGGLRGASMLGLLGVCRGVCPRVSCRPRASCNVVCFPLAGAEERTALLVVQVGGVSRSPTLLSVAVMLTTWGTVDVKPSARDF